MSCTGGSPAKTSAVRPTSSEVSDKQERVRVFGQLSPFRWPFLDGRLAGY